MTPDENADPVLVLASTSPYRRQLLERLGLPFQCASPQAEEDHREDESPRQRALRLACAKSRSVPDLEPGAVVIGSDQVAALGSEVLDKPGDLDSAVAQLQRSSGNEVVFHTAVCVFNATTREAATAIDRTVVRFRCLSDAEIHRYLEREPALDCAGSFKCEALGITLFEAIESRDPTALIGLPLIEVARMLRGAGFELP